MASMVTIRPPRLVDDGVCRRILALQEEAFSDELALTSVSAPPLEEGIDDLRRSSERFAAAYRGGGELVGLIAWQRHGDEIEPTRLFVDRSHRRLGIGASLMAFMMAQERDARQVVLEAATLNEPAVALYGRLGFVPVSRRRVGPNVELVRYERPLTSS